MPRGLDETFAYFSDARNLEALTPTWVRFQILTPPPIRMQEGTIIEYRIRIRAIPMRWRSVIKVWEPPHRFVDLQVRGPYRWWCHEHRFEPCEGGTRLIDEVEYAVHFGWLVERLLVRRDLDRIFDYRAEALRSALAPMDHSHQS